MQTPWLTVAGNARNSYSMRAWAKPSSLTRHAWRLPTFNFNKCRTAAIWGNDTQQQRFARSFEPDTLFSYSTVNFRKPFRPTELLYSQSCSFHPHPLLISMGRWHDSKNVITADLSSASSDPGNGNAISRGTFSRVPAFRIALLPSYKGGFTWGWIDTWGGRAAATFVRKGHEAKKRARQHTWNLGFRFFARETERVEQMGGRVEKEMEGVLICDWFWVMALCKGRRGNVKLVSSRILLVRMGLQDYKWKQEKVS